MQPVILVTADRRDPSGLAPGPRVRPRRAEFWIGAAYVRAVRLAGGLPLVVPAGETAVARLIGLADGVVLTGGHFDIHPSWYGEGVTDRLDRVEPERTEMEISLAASCLAQRIPLLGVCGGMQAMAVAAGGTLVQDLPKHPLDHEQPDDPATPWHDVVITEPASRWFGERTSANSTHHQAVRSPGSGLVACGHTEDGVIEVIAATTGFALGVQWHPELLDDLRPYRALIEAARARAADRAL